MAKKHIPPSGISCIYCGCSLDSVQDGYDHQESGECPGPFPENDVMVNIAYGSFDPLSKEERDAAEARVAALLAALRPERTPEQRADRLASMPLRPGESQEQRNQAVKAIREGK